MRILSRTPLKNLSSSLFKKLKKNPKLLTNSKLYFETNFDPKNALIHLKETGIYDKMYLKQDIINVILKKVKSYKFQN